MTSGELAIAAGVSFDTLRFYERRGLLPAPPRTGGGRRFYGEQAVIRVRFIKRAQSLGFSLAEVDELLRLQGRGAEPVTVRSVASQKLVEVEQKLRRLRAVRKALRQLVDDCEKSNVPTHCPILDALGREPVAVNAGVAG